MLNRKNKKGFTLAELLIVVAIIAVLVAIAVPLFVGGLQKAQDGTFQANKRAAKAAAVTFVLSDNTIKLDEVTADNAAQKLWFIVHVDPDTGDMGAVKELTFESGVEETNSYTDWTTGTKVGTATTATKTAGDIVVHLTVTEIKKA